MSVFCYVSYFTTDSEDGLLGVIYKVHKISHVYPNTSKMVKFWEKDNLGMILQLSTYLSDLWSNTLTSDSKTYRSNIPFVPIRNSTIILPMSRYFDWAVETLYLRIGCGQTDHWPEMIPNWNISTWSTIIQKMNTTTLFS